MRVCIVGHGPSITGVEKGKEIDQHDVVVRMKLMTGTLQHPEHFGTRTDVASGSMNLVNRMGEWDCREYWVYVDSRFEGYPDEVIENEILTYLPATTRWDRSLCDIWNEYYRNQRDAFELGSQQERKPSSDELGHRHMSAGLHTLIYACAFLEPESVTLAGFDNVVTGGWTWSHARGPGWYQYPDHRFDVEHRMLPVIEQMFGTEIRPL